MSADQFPIDTTLAVAYTLQDNKRIAARSVISMPEAARHPASTRGAMRL